MTERPPDMELCHYHGTLRGAPNSWAAVSTCDNLVSGAMFDGSKMHFLENNANSVNQSTHYHFRETDRIHNNLK